MFSALARFRVPPRVLGSGVGLTDGTGLGVATMGVAVGTTTGVGILVAVEIGLGVGVCAPRALGVGVAATLGVRVEGMGAEVGPGSGPGWPPQDTDHNNASPTVNPTNEIKMSLDFMPCP